MKITEYWVKDFKHITFDLNINWCGFLPPASEGWGKVIFSVCPHLRGGGVPHPRSGWGVPCPRSVAGGYPSQVWVGVPIPGLGGGVPCLRSGLGVQYPIPGLDGEGVPGVPPSGARSGWWGRGTPSQVWWGTPGLDGGGYLRYPQGQVWMGGTLSQVWMVGGTPHHQDWMGYPTNTN